MSNTRPPFANQVLVDDQNPWPGLVSFTEEASAYFCGRSEEKAELFRLVTRETLSVVFGQSGLGKTSLLQAGLFPDLRRADYLPAYIRLNYAPGSPPLAAQMLQALQDAVDRSATLWRMPVEGETLWEYFQHRDTIFSNSAGRPVIPVLVLDQFEEIFTLGRSQAERAQALVGELECLVENRAPKRVQARFEQTPDEMDRYDFDRRAFKLVLSLREDFVAELEGFRNRLRGLAQNRFRLQRMNGRQGLAVALEAGHGLIDELAARSVMENLGAEGGSGDGDLGSRIVEPALLSVVLRELNLRRQREGAARITPAMVTVAQDILRDFYNDKIADVPPAARAALEDSVLSDSGRYRVQTALDDLAAAGVSAELVEQLVNRRILRYDERYGARVVELTHDRLVPVVQESRLRRVEKQKRQAVEQAAREAAAQAQRKLDEAKRLFTQAESLWQEFRDQGAMQKDDWRFARLAQIEDTLVKALTFDPDAKEASALLAGVRRLFVETAIQTKDLNLASIYLQKLRGAAADQTQVHDLATELTTVWAQVDPARNEHVILIRKRVLQTSRVAIFWSLGLLVLTAYLGSTPLLVYVAVTSLVLMMNVTYSTIQAVLVAQGDEAALSRLNRSSASMLIFSVASLHPFAGTAAIVILHRIDRIRMSRLYWTSLSSDRKTEGKTGNSVNPMVRLEEEFKVASWQKRLSTMPETLQLREQAHICLYLALIAMPLSSILFLNVVPLLAFQQAQWPVLGAFYSAICMFAPVSGWLLIYQLQRLQRAFNAGDFARVLQYTKRLPYSLLCSVCIPIVAMVLAWHYVLPATHQMLFDPNDLPGSARWEVERFLWIMALYPAIGAFFYAVLGRRLSLARRELIQS